MKFCGTQFQVRILLSDLNVNKKVSKILTSEVNDLLELDYSLCAKIDLRSECCEVPTCLLILVDSYSSALSNNNPISF